MNHADRVLVLDQGQLIANGSPKQGLSQGIVNKVWGVDAKWIGTKGAQALVIK